MDYYGHYVVFNINVPTTLLNGTAAGQFTDNFTVIEPRQYSKVDSLRFRNGIGGGITAGDRNATALPRQTRRIVESIAMFMPQGLNFNTANAYEDISLGEMGGKLLTGPVYGAVAQAAQIGRAPINPGVEVFYVNTFLRAFNFIFMCAPRNEQESQNLDHIIKTLRFHGAPEINTGVSGLGAGITWIPPAEFDITFFNKGVENRKFPRINTCVLETMQIDYNDGGEPTAFFTNGYSCKVSILLNTVKGETPWQSFTKQQIRSTAKHMWVIVKT
jgi:hypothetical protein